MPVIMSLEGPRRMPWSQLHGEALGLIPRPVWRATTQLSGLFDPIKANPFLTIAALAFGIWLGGTSSGGKLVTKAKAAVKTKSKPKA